MVTRDRLDILAKDLEKAVDATKKVFAIAPDIIPSILDEFVYLPKERVKENLLGFFNKVSEDKQENICHALESAVSGFMAIVVDMEDRIKARQQPADLPRREGPKPFKQFRQRKGEWA